MQVVESVSKIVIELSHFCMSNDMFNNLFKNTPEFRKWHLTHVKKFWMRITRPPPLPHTHSECLVPLYKLVTLVQNPVLFKYNKFNANYHLIEMFNNLYSSRCILHFAYCYNFPSKKKTKTSTTTSLTFASMLLMLVWNWSEVNSVNALSVYILI